MNILITGANGFIGQALCKRMLADGYQVHGAVRSAAKMTVLPSGVEGVMIGPETDWSEALVGIDEVVHLAARVHVMRESSVDPLAAYRKVNVEGTKCLAIAAVNAGVKRFVYISSVKVNGESTEDKSSDQEKNREQGPGVGGREKTKVRGQEGELKGTFSEKDVPEP
ncbi:MAG: NAD-dependent epimerase/dehydratase family protein, partial [Deltaproteobacteria bacterium]|nr:NAD-dependent epimerase/dehydratase family protein [Deltaproteobacteria bacterium]